MGSHFNDDYLVCDADYAAVINQEVIPALQQIRKDQIIHSPKDQIPLSCSVFPAQNPLGTVLVLHGFTENTYKYSELIWSLVKNGFSVIAYDQRGHGCSGRSAGLSHPSVTHVDLFEDYVDDLELVCSSFLSDCPKPWMIFAHSMGGAVASLFLEKHPEVFSAACLCAPMIAPRTGGLPSFAVSVICKAACLIGHGKHIPFIMKPYSGSESFETSCATDPARFFWYDGVKAAHREYWNSVPTYRWTLESVRVTKKILAPGAPESIICPVLLSTAGHDFSVMPEPQKQFISRIPNGHHLVIGEARHEIFRSVNDVFFPWWHKNLLFLKEGKI
jgi:lysophospholipase